MHELMQDVFLNISFENIYCYIFNICKTDEFQEPLFGGATIHLFETKYDTCKIDICVTFQLHELIQHAFLNHIPL